MNDIEPYLEEFSRVIKETLSQMEEVAAKEFSDRLTEKLNEQNSAQENSGSSR